MATSGPGALNLVTGIGSCYFDSVPCLFITGQVNTYEYKFDRPVRQMGFQETDIVSVVKPITKNSEMILDPATIRYHLEKSVFTAKTGRPGPVLLDIPMNIQRADIDPRNLPGFFDSDEYLSANRVAAQCDGKVLSDLVGLLRKATRPVILAGGGVRSAGATGELRSFVEATGIPVVCSLMGLDAFDHDDPLFMGMIGSYGNRYSNLTLANSDLLLILGSRLDSRQTGTRPETFGRAAIKVHVDVDPQELNSRITVDSAINCGLKEFLTSMNKLLVNHVRPDYSSWYSTLERYRSRFPTRSTSVPTDMIEPNMFMKVLSDRCRGDDFICLDVGQNQMWAAQSFHLRQKQRMLASGGMGAMGFALPAAIGAVKACPGRRAVVITGDGGIQVNLQELELVARCRLPIKIIIMNNSCLGMVRQFQDMYFNGRRQSTVIGYGAPDFCRIAEAFGIGALRIGRSEEIEKILEEGLNFEGPVVMDVTLDRDTSVNPKLVVNRPIEDMSPHLDRNELRDQMLIGLVEEKDVPT
jgi:acetolactate synthase-1/2/3 large subunit